MNNKLFNGYWMGYQPNGNDLGATPSYVNKVTLFVAAPTADGSSVDINYLCKAYSKEQQIAWAKQLQAQGIEVLMSLMDTSTTHWNNVDIPAFVQTFKNEIIDGEWGLNGVDIDLESGMPSNVWAATFTSLIQEFRKVLGPKAASPSGMSKSRISVAAYRINLEQPILSAAGADLDWLNTMAYWNSAEENEQMFNTYLQYVSQVNLGIGVDYQSGQSTDLVQTGLTAQFAAKTNGCGMMEFALNNDCPTYSGQPQWTWASTIEKNLPPQQTPQTILMLTQGVNPGYTVTEYLENQINANGGKFSMSFCGLPNDLRPTKLEFRFINGIPPKSITMNFTQGCPTPDWSVTEYITNQINANNGDFVMTFPLNAPPGIQLNTIEFQFE